MEPVCPAITFPAIKSALKVRLFPSAKSATEALLSVALKSSRGSVAEWPIIDSQRVRDAGDVQMGQGCVAHLLVVDLNQGAVADLAGSNIRQ